MGTTLRREPVTDVSRNLVEPGLKVFAVETIVWKKVRQQELLNCPLPATMAAVAKVWPDQVRLMLSPSQELVDAPYKSWFDDKAQPTKESDYFHGDRIVGVRFADGWQVRCTPLLYQRPGNTNLWFAKSTDGGGWISYIEKAYAMYRGEHRYEKLEILTVEQIFYDLVGSYDKISVDHAEGKRTVYKECDGSGSGYVEAYEKGDLKKMLNRAQDRPTIVTSWSDSDTLITDHTYVAEKLTGDDIHVWEAFRNTSEKISLKKFFQECNAVYQARGKLFKS